MPWLGKSLSNSDSANKRRAKRWPLDGYTLVTDTLPKLALSYSHILRTVASPPMCMHSEQRAEGRN